MIVKLSQSNLEALEPNWKAKKKNKKTTTFSFSSTSGWDMAPEY